MTSSLHELDQVKFLQAYRFRWNASLIPLWQIFFFGGFFIWRIIRIDIDWRMLGVMIWCKKAGKILEFCFEDWLEGLCEVEKDCTWNLIWVQWLGLTKSPKPISISRTWDFSWLFQNLRRASQTFTLTQEYLTRDFCTCHTFGEAWSGKNIGEQLCLKHATASWPPPMPDAGKAGWCSW